MSLAKKARTPVRWLALLSFCALTNVPSAGWAGDARIAEESGPNHVVIEANDATLDEILSLLAVRFEFTVERVARPSGTNRLSGRLQGSLDRLLERVLRQQGYMIVRSAGAGARISKVILLDSKGRALEVATGAGGAGRSKGQAAGPVAPPAPEPVAKAPAPVTPSPLPTASDGTLRQLEEIGRQMMSMGQPRPIEATSQAPVSAGTVAALPSSPPAPGSYAGDIQQLTQLAVTNVQSLTASLRAACLGPSCPR